MSYQVTLSAPERASLINLRARGEGRAVLAATLGLALPAPSGRAAANASVLVFGLGPDEWLLRTPLPEEEAWLARLEDALSAGLASAVLVSDAYRVVRIAGSHTREVLAQATGVDLHPDRFPPGHATRAAFAKTSALLHHVDDRPAFDVYVDSTLAAYVAKWLAAASGKAAPSR